MSKEFVDFFYPTFCDCIWCFGGRFGSFWLVWPKVESFLLRLNAINQNRQFTKEMQQLRFGAYERLLLFTHRVEPQQLMLRNHSADISTDRFVRQILNEVESEYQHNLTQQLYVTDTAWTFVGELKDNTLSLLRNAKEGLPKDAPVDQYISAVLQHVKNLEQNPYAAVQLILKKELSV